MRPRFITLLRSTLLIYFTGVRNCSYAGSYARYIHAAGVRRGGATRGGATRGCGAEGCGADGCGVGCCAKCEEECDEKCGLRVMMCAVMAGSAVGLDLDYRISRRESSGTVCYKNPHGVRRVR